MLEPGELRAAEAAYNQAADMSADSVALLAALDAAQNLRRVRDTVAHRIYEKSKTEALAATIDEFITDDGSTSWFATSRASAMSYVAHEEGVRFVDVRARRAYMRVDLQAIRDLAADLAVDEYDGGPAPTDDELPIAYTWEGDGWLWTGCKKADPGAIALWECTTT